MCYRLFIFKKRFILLSCACWDHRNCPWQCFAMQIVNSHSSFLRSDFPCLLLRYRFYSQALKQVRNVSFARLKYTQGVSNLLTSKPLSTLSPSGAFKCSDASAISCCEFTSADKDIVTTKSGSSWSWKGLWKLPIPVSKQHQLEEVGFCHAHSVFCSFQGQRLHSLPEWATSSSV